MSILTVTKLRCEYKSNPLGLDVSAPRFSWQLEASARGVWQSAYRIQVSTDRLFAAEGDVWDSGLVQSDACLHLEYQGVPLQPRTRYYYRVMAQATDGLQSPWSEPACWETGLLTSANWTAQWMGAEGTGDASPHLRKEFQLSGEVAEARIYATALGLYKLYLNGKPASDHEFTPGWTSYSKRLQYQTYDVTSQLAEGSNTVGVLLGNGWYKGGLTWELAKNIYGQQTAALVQLHIRYQDGREEVVQSGPDWKWATGPVLLSEIYDGETYDARQELTGWAASGYDDSKWSAVSILDYTKNHITAQENDPCRIINELTPIALIRTPKGETVLDMGQNMVGWVRLKVSGPAGSTIVLKHAEVLDAAGNFYTDNLRKAKQTVTYICRSGDEEVYEPHFTFQGFRYVLVEGYPGELALANFTGQVIHTDMEQTGLFECSDPSVNQLQHNILWGQKGNFLDVPTDCPQRDERLGWTGDAQMFIRTAAYNLNVASFFTKWLRDLKADQFPSGGIPHVIPNVLLTIPAEGQSSAAWGDAAVICPWTLYLCYGDKRILQEQFPSMKAWVEYIRGQGDSPYLWNTGHHYGDWLALDAKENSYVGATPRDLIATAFYAYSCALLAEAAAVLGYEGDAAEYRGLHLRIKEAFQAEFVTPNGRLASHTQTAYVLALMFDLLDEKERTRAALELEKLIRAEKVHLTTGFVGTPYLCHVLTATGRNDLAYELVLQRDYPSWLYAVDQGATTIWEHWDGIKPDGTFWSRDMNSYNHYAYGAIGDWLYRTAAGLDAEKGSPGYRRLVLAPKPGGGFTWVKASLQTMYGTVKSAWQLNEATGRIHLEFTVPANTSAVAVLPGAVAEQVEESGRRLNGAEVPGVYEWKEQPVGVMVELGSGSYNFDYPYNR